MSLDVEGNMVDLNIIKDQRSDKLFLPFANARNGNETYRTGLYLEIEM